MAARVSRCASGDLAADVAGAIKRGGGGLSALESTLNAHCATLRDALEEIEAMRRAAGSGPEELGSILVGVAVRLAALRREVVHGRDQV
jgi:hypothetical protein